MAGNLQPLDDKFPIVGQDGRPTLYFIQWAQQRQIDITDALTLAGLEEYLIQHPLHEGNGIALTPSGNLTDEPLISVRNGTGLDFDVMGNLKIADTAVVPGSYGDATHVGQFTVDQQGRLTAAANVAISGGGSGGYSFAWPDRGPNGASAGAVPCLGMSFVPVVDMTVAGLWATVTTVAGATYRVAIYATNAAGLIAAITADSANIATPGAVTGACVGANFASPVTLVAGTRYACTFRRTDLLDTTNCGVWGIATAALPTYSSLPSTFTSTEQTKYATIAKKNPIVGDTFTFGGAGYYSIGVRFYC